MKPFLSEDFMLQTQTAKTLYHQYAKDMPIYDYHCHLPVQDIAENKRFENLTQIWLYGDHYKWRAMRANGVAEDFITGNRSDFEKFQAWAATVPKTLGNPLYQWTHLELKRYFGIEGTLLNENTAKDIYDKCTKILQTDAFSSQEILQKMDIWLICTTDDPVENLEYHQQLRNDQNFPVRVLPAFRPDKAMAVESPEPFNDWVGQLEAVADTESINYETYMEALRQRHDFFHKTGCRLSDHGIERPFAEDYTDAQIRRIFEKARSGKMLEESEIRQFKSAMLIELAIMDAEKSWTQQFHLGALRWDCSADLSAC
jgi:glucuronate isomerase